MEGLRISGSRAASVAGRHTWAVQTSQLLSVGHLVNGGSDPDSSIPLRTSVVQTCLGQGEQREGQGTRSRPGQAPTVLARGSPGWLHGDDPTTVTEVRLDRVLG